MSSSIFFKFKSQKEPTRLPFDGTAISVFDAKRDIITIHKLGDGTEFDLAIYNEESNEEYIDDTTMIPRGTSVTARRLPPAKPGRGTAQRYVTGKMPTAALNAGRVEKTKQPSGPQKGPAAGLPGLNAGGQTEEERIAAMFQASSEQWNQTQEQMASARPIHNAQGNFKKVNANVPAHPPPNGYVCYRCGEKGHWIQQCPTNADPNFDGRPKVKRTTGIPKSFLRTVEKPVITDDEDAKPMSVMVNAEGEYVVAEPDRASWELYQQKTKAAGLTAEAAAEQQILEEKGLACSIDGKIFKNAVKTPCCGKTYCDDCIENALVESDLVCPNCDSKEVLLDRLIPDTEVRQKVTEYLESKKDAAAAKEKSKSPTPTPATVKSEPVVKKEQVGSPKIEVTTPSGSNPKKRPAEDDAGNDMKRTNSSTSNESSSKRIKSGPMTPNQQNASLVKSTSPGQKAVVPAVNGEQNQNNLNNMPNGLNQNNLNNMPNGMNQNNMNNMGFGQNGFMPNYNPNNFDYNQMAMMNGMGNMNMGYNNNMGMMGMGMNNMMPNGMPYMNNGMNMNMGMGMNGPMNMGYNQNMMQYNNMNNGMGNGYYGNNNNGYNQGYNQMNNNMQMQRQNIPQMGQNQNQVQTHNQNTAFNNNNNQNNQISSHVSNNNNGQNFSRKIFSEPFPSEEDSPYMRKPVNPNRHMRPKRARPSDYTAVSGGYE